MDETITFTLDGERLEGDLGWEVTQVYGLTETSPFITVCDPLPEHGMLSTAERAEIKARQGVELITSGDLRVVNTESGQEVPTTGSRSARSWSVGTSCSKGITAILRQLTRRSAMAGSIRATPPSCIRMVTPKSGSP